jgi:putative ABC transport system ATP-binding protein
MQNLLTGQDIEVARAASPVLRFPDIAIAPGEKVLLLGPSGSGKTTWLSVLAGLLAPSTGKVTVDGEDLYGLPARRRDRLRGRRFGFVFQTLHLLPSLTLRQNVALAASMAGLPVDEQRIDFLLTTLGLADKAHRRPEALSIGEQQRTAIARAVLNRPAVIVADEPTSALDDANADLAASLLQQQARETGAALLVATHDHRIAQYFETVIRLDALNALKEAA